MAVIMIIIANEMVCPLFLLILPRDSSQILPTTTTPFLSEKHLVCRGVLYHGLCIYQGYIPHI